MPRLLCPLVGPTRRLWKRADHRQVYGGSTLEAAYAVNVLAYL
jgi:hypothetical protein